MERFTAVYLRVSSRSQDTRAQELELTRWAESQTATLRWYRDQRTGTKMQRPGMDRLLADVASGCVERIVVWRLDRLGRTASGLTKLFEDLQARRVGLFSLKDSLDLDTPAGRLMANVLASVSVYETEVRRERQQAGIDAARAAGKRWGGSNKGRRVKVTDEQEALIARLKGEGASIVSIAKCTGLSRPTIYSVLASATSKATVPA